MSDADTIRTSAPKPQYPLQNSNARPNISLNQIGVRPPGQQQIQQSNGQQQRPAPPPLRRVDSRGNILVNQQRPPGTLPHQQGRPISGQNPQGRPQPPGNWSGTAGSPTTPTQQQQNRPPFPYGPPGQNQVRPPFQRAPGQHPVTAPNQLPFRPPYPQQQQQQQQQQQRSGAPTITSNQSSPQNSTMSSEVLARSNLSNSFINENDDDDDVVIGNASTPQKYKPADPMTQSQYGTLDSRSTLPPTEDIIKKPSTNYTSFQDEAIKPKSGQSYFGDSEELLKDKTNDKVQNSGFDNEKPTMQKMPPKGSVPVSRKYGEDIVDRRPPSGDESKGRGLDAKSPGKPPKMDYQRRHFKGDNDSGVDESTQGNERNGPESPGSPLKSPTKPSGISRPPSTTPSNKSTKSRSTSRSRALKTPEPEPVKKVPMNKIQVGHAPSPNLKAVRSKIGSLDNAAYKPGGGHVKIESKKIEIKAAPRIEAKNDKYISKGGEKKIVTTKLQWNAKSKIGSLENAHHKPGGGDKKIECLKPDFKDKAKPKVGSKDNVKHTPGGGDIKIQTHKLEIKAQSKVGSLDNVKHKPGGGNKQIFDDKEYLKNVEHPVALTPPSQSPVPPAMTTSSGADENLNQQQS